MGVAAGLLLWSCGKIVPRTVLGLPSWVNPFSTVALKRQDRRAWIMPILRKAKRKSEKESTTSFPFNTNMAFVSPTARRAAILTRRVDDGGSFISNSRTAPTRLYSSSSSSKSPANNNNINNNKNDQSATAQSRAAFSMPKASPDDSQTAQQQQQQQQKSNTSAVKNISGINDNKNKIITWNQLGLWTELIECLEQEMQLPSPTMVQQMVIAPLLSLDSSSSINNNKNTTRHMAFLAATGSGKTLAYCLPVMQMLKQQEVFGDSRSSAAVNTIISDNVSPTMVQQQQQQRAKQRPRAILLAPTRELCLQIAKVCKQLSHSIKLSVAIVTGGEGMTVQRQRLAQRSVDVLVATPGRLLQHVQAGNLVLSQKYLRFVVLDEMDTMIEQGFAQDLQHLLYPLLYHKRPSKDTIVHPDTDLVADAPSIILTSATMTQAIQKMIGDDSNSNNAKDAVVIQAKKHFTKSATSATSPTDQQQHSSTNPKLPPMVLPRMKVYKAPGLHKTVPRLQQVFVDTAAIDKISLLIDVLSNSNNPSMKQGVDDSLTMVFCNTAASCRAVEFALAEARFNQVLSYHGELNSAMRSDNLQKFRASKTAAILVCTDLAARGLDIPAVDHVVMFDFPLNALDYLHRSGRTARGAALLQTRPGNGKVTALVSKRDQVLANAISQAVQKGEALDGLSSRKTDYLPGGRLNARSGGGSATGGGRSKRLSSRLQGNRRSGTSASSPGSKLNSSGTFTPRSSKKSKPKDTTMKKYSANSR